MDWKTQFTKRAWLWIGVETSVLAILALTSLTLTAIIWWDPDWIGLNVPASKAASQFQRFALVFLAGILGGTAFSMKWLHHSVGLGPRSDEFKLGWTEDRRLWRLVVPWLSGIIAAAFYAVLEAQLLQLEIKTEDPQAFAVAVGFIVGYFSDRAAAKLKDVANVLFGKSDKEGEG